MSALVPRHREAPLFRTSRPVSRALGGAFGAAAAAAGAGSATVGLALGAAAGPEVGTVAGAALLLAGIVPAVELGRGWRAARAQLAGGAEPYRRIAGIVWEALRRAGRVADEPVTIAATEAELDDGTGEIAIEAVSASLTDQRTLADALGELFGPVRTPRFLLETGSGGRSAFVRGVLRRVARRRTEGHFVPVPSLIGRRRRDAEAFAAAWERELGPCVLHAMDGPGQLALMARARRGGGGLVPATSRDQWQ